MRAWQREHMLLQYILGLMGNNESCDWHETITAYCYVWETKVMFYMFYSHSRSALKTWQLKQRWPCLFLFTRRSAVNHSHSLVQDSQWVQECTRPITDGLGDCSSICTVSIFQQLPRPSSPTYYWAYSEAGPAHVYIHVVMKINLTHRLH